MALVVKVPVTNMLLSPSWKVKKNGVFSGKEKKERSSVSPFAVMSRSKSSSSSSAVIDVEVITGKSKDIGIGLPIMVNSCTGEMGKAVIESAVKSGLHIVPFSFAGPEESGQSVQVAGKKIQVKSNDEKEYVLASALDEYPDLIVVDYTVPEAVNDNAELYCKLGVPFVMGTTGGDRNRLYKEVENSKIYAVISPQMGKQVVAFLAAMDIMAERFPGAYTGYSLMALESHQASKKDTSGTAKAVVSSFQKLGVKFDEDQISSVRDPKVQQWMIGVPKEHLDAHAFHVYRLDSPDKTVEFEFQHNVCGRSIYAEGTVDAVRFLAKKVQSKASKRIYNMIDVLREGNMR